MRKPEFVARRLDTKSYHSHRCSARSVWPNGRGGSCGVATAGPAGHSTAEPAALEAFKNTRSSCGAETWRQRASEIGSTRALWRCKGRSGLV